MKKIRNIICFVLCVFSAVLCSACTFDNGTQPSMTAAEAREVMNEAIENAGEQTVILLVKYTEDDDSDSIIEKHMANVTTYYEMNDEGEKWIEKSSGTWYQFFKKKVMPGSTYEYKKSATSKISDLITPKKYLAGILYSSGMEFVSANNVSGNDVLTFSVEKNSVTYTYKFTITNDLISSVVITPENGETENYSYTYADEVSETLPTRPNVTWTTV